MPSPPPIDILCEDGPLLAVNKPAGLPTQGVPEVVDSLESMVKAYLKEKYQKPGNVYLGVPHRLDRPVSGVVIFARNSKAAARLAEQFRLRQVRKWYLAIVEGRPDPPNGTLSDWLLKEPDFAKMNVVPEGTPGAKLATLSYRVLPQTRSVSEGIVQSGLARTVGSLSDNSNPVIDRPLSLTLSPEAGARGQMQSLVEIELHTGRMHQIRVQFASRGWPIVGDTRYGFSKPGLSDAGTNTDAIFLHAHRLKLRHPVRYDAISLVAPPPEHWPPVDETGLRL